MENSIIRDFVGNHKCQKISTTSPNVSHNVERLFLSSKNDQEFVKKTNKMSGIGAFSYQPGYLYMHVSPI